jgi:hypothetical protein
MEYEVTVYRTMVQKVTLVKESPIPLSGRHLSSEDRLKADDMRTIISEEAEDEAAEMYDYEWEDLSAEIEYTWTGIERKK